MVLLYKHWQNEPDATLEKIPLQHQQTLKEIAGKFGNQPFSMAFVGSYLTDKQSNLSEFLKAYESKEKNLLQKYKLLSTYHLKNEDKHTSSVATAFLLRFDQISTPASASEKDEFLAVTVKEYLKLSAFIGTDNIPEELFRQCLLLLHPNQTKFIEDEDFIEEIRDKFKPSGIFKRDSDTKTLTTHRIVQEIMRFQIEAEEDLLLETLAEVLADNFEPFDFTNKEIVERYLSHVEAFLEYLEANKPPERSNLKLENKSTAKLCNSYARYFEQYGQYAKAEKYYLYFKAICESVEDIDENWKATSYNNLANLYESQGRYAEAEPLFKKVIKIFESELGENHPSTATSYNNLAGLYESQGRFAEAEPLYKKALAIRESELGENHPLTAQSYNNLAGLYSKIGNLTLAKKYQQKSLNIRLVNFGENHPDVAQSYWWLGTFCQTEENYQEALDNYSKAKEIFLRFLAEEHPRVQNLQGFIDGCEKMLG